MMQCSGHLQLPRVIHSAFHTHTHAHTHTHTHTHIHTHTHARARALDHLVLHTHTAESRSHISESKYAQHFINMNISPVFQCKMDCLETSCNTPTASH